MGSCKVQKGDILKKTNYFGLQKCSYFMLAEITNETNNAKDEFLKSIQKDITEKVEEVQFETRCCRAYNV